MKLMALGSGTERRLATGPLGTYAHITLHGAYIAESNHDPSSAGLGVWGAFVLYKGRYIMASHGRNMVDMAAGPGGGR